MIEERLERLETTVNAEAEQLRRVEAHLGAVQAQIQDVQAHDAERWRAAQAALARGDDDRERLLQAAKVIYSDEPRQRERLWTVRRTTSYRDAYREPQPLVSVVIATYTNYDLLRTRSIPSVLAQTYQNFEVQVVGDAAPDETAGVIQEFDDPRISYHNLAIRGPYPDDRTERWMVAGTLPWIEAVQRARGRWIASLDDDDAFVPQHIEALLGLARRDGLELSYGKFRMHLPEGESQVVGVFPPRYGEFALQGALYHADLRFFVPELADAIFSLPGDWAMIERMLRTGVRFGMLDEVVVDYFPSLSGVQPADV